jgi:hypothetical protein
MMSTHQRHVRKPTVGLPSQRALAVALAWVVTVAFVLAAAGRPAMAAEPIAADESAVSTGSWFCSRYTAAVGAPGSAAAAEVASAVRAFALGYVYGVSEAVGRSFPEAADNDRRIVELLDRGCTEDTARAVRDATLLAGRAMLEDARSAGGMPAAEATGTLSCSAYLVARASGIPPAPALAPLRVEPVRNWADGYINARFERAGRGLIPTAKNKALMLDRFSAACTAQPSATVREAARSVVEATLPGK